MSVDMARIAAAEGVSLIACTPHILPTIYDNTGPTIKSAVAILRKALDLAEIPIQLVTGADVHVTPDLIKGLRDGRILALNDSRYVLLEPPHHVPPPRLEEYIFALHTAGYVAVLTHPERLSWIGGYYPLIKQLVRNGVLMQLTAGSLKGRFGKSPRYWAERMLEEGLCHILATDAHDVARRPPSLAEGRDAAAKIVGEEEAINLVWRRPLGIIENVSPSQLVPLAQATAEPSKPSMWGRAGVGTKVGRVKQLYQKSQALLGRLLPILALAFVLTHCTTNDSGVTATATAPEAMSSQSQANAAADVSEAENMPNNGASPSLPPPDPPQGQAPSIDYRIGAQDVLQVTVYQVPDLSASGLNVDVGGNISLPLLGQTHVAGLTTEQAAKKIATALGKKYLQKPQVFVALQKSAQRIIVSGAVTKPAAIAPTGGLTLSQAIVAAGGLSEVANPNRVHVARISGQKVNDAIFDLDAILSGRAKDPIVYGGDMIVAESSGTKVALKNLKDILPFTALVGLLSGTY